MRSRPPTLIVGLGYTGTTLARRLSAAGAEVAGTTRDPSRARALSKEGIPAAQIDLEARDVDGHLAACIPRGGAVVHTAPPLGEDTARDAGLHRLLRLVHRLRPAHLVYLSTTGVYAERAGGWVTEESPVDPSHPRAARRLEAESALLETAAAIDATGVVLRAAGIYGPGRGLAQRIAKGEVRLWGGGHNWINRIHVEDLAALIEAALSAPPSASGIYNAADARPATLREHALWLAERMGAPPPPEAPLAEAPSPSLIGNKRVDGRRAREVFGVRLRYPSFVEGFSAS